nr:uncharacterized protein LOC123766505 [Procambarus clarkii]
MMKFSTRRFVKPARLWVKVACVLLPLGLLHSRYLTSKPREHKYLHLSTRAHLLEAKYSSEYLPYIVFPVVEEEFVSDNKVAVTSTRKRLYSVTAHPASPSLKSLTYLHRLLPSIDAELLKEEADWTPWGPKLESISDYFRYLNTPQTSCPKLLRLGGEYCIASLDYKFHFDGYKFVCADPRLEIIGGRNSSCLALSFGIMGDTSFDESATLLPCEVHMFDVINYDPELAKIVDSAFFHTEGLSGKNVALYYKNVNLTYNLDTLKGHILKNNLFPRPIHILKVDIENDEWEAFKNIAKDPIFDVVGQVALEVHAMVVGELNEAPIEDKLRLLQERYDVLRMIEARGFRRVLYLENDFGVSPLYDNVTGTRYETAGELLYVNTNWYNATFKQHLAASFGFPFRGT